MYLRPITIILSSVDWRVGVALAPRETHHWMLSFAAYIQLCPDQLVCSEKRQDGTWLRRLCKEEPDGLALEAVQLAKKKNRKACYQKSLFEGK